MTVTTKADYTRIGRELFKNGRSRPESEYKTWMTTAKQQGWDDARAEHLGALPEKQQAFLATIHKSELAPGVATPAYELPKDADDIIKELRAHEDAQLAKYPLRQYVHSIRGALQHKNWGYWSEGAKAHTLDLVRQLETEPDHRRGSRLHRKLLVLINKHEIVPIYDHHQTR